MASGDVRGIPDAPGSSPKRPVWSPKAALEIAAVAAFLSLYFVVHWGLTVPAFGQEGAAHLAVDGAAFHFSGHVRLDTTDYRVLASPLYVHGLRLALSLGVSLSHLPLFMTRVSLASSVVAVLASYLLFRGFAGRVGAGVAAGFLALAPAFWLAGTYGTPAAPALAAFLSALLAFSRALDADDTRRFWKLTGLATVFVFAAFALEGDFVLSGLAFPALVLARKRLGRRALCAALAVVALGLALDLVYVKCLVTPAPRLASVSATPSISHFVATFGHRFPFDWDGLTDKDNLARITHAPGPYLFVVGILGVVSLLLSPRHFELGAFAALWCFPSVLFRALTPESGAEAYFSALPPFVLGAALVVTRAAESGTRQAFLALLVALTGYFSDRTGDPHVPLTVLPRTNLADLSESLAEQSAEVEKRARGFAKLGESRKALIARSSLPFGVFEAMADAVRRGGRPDYDGTDLKITFAGGRTQIVRFVAIVNPSQANAATRKLREDGYEVIRQD